MCFSLSSPGSGTVPPIEPRSGLGTAAQPGSLAAAHFMWSGAVAGSTHVRPGSPGGGLALCVGRQLSQEKVVFLSEAPELEKTVRRIRDAA